MKKIIQIMLSLMMACVVFGCSSQEDEPKTITVYTRDTTSGTREGFFTVIGMKDASEDNSLLAQGYVEVGSNGDMMNSIKNDEYGIGYISLASLNESGLLGLKFEGVNPTEENVLNGSYSLTRHFNYVVRSEFNDVRKQQIIEAFNAYLTTKEGKATILATDGIIELNDEDPSWEDIKNQYPICNEDNSDVIVRFGGSTSVEKMAKALSSEFSLKCGNFQYEHEHTGSGDAYKRTQGSEKDGANSLDIAFASREFKLDSDEPCLEGTYGLICVDAIVVVVNQNNTLFTDVNADLLKDIFTGTKVTWEA